MARHSQDIFAMRTTLCVLGALAAVVSAKTYFKETFDSEDLPQ